MRFLIESGADTAGDGPENRWQWAVVVVLVSVGALCQAVSSSLRFQNADSLVPVFVSLYGWTPYFWDQDRYGMLIPLLAVPIQNPFLNLEFQQILRSGAALAAPFALSRVFATRATWFPIGLLTLVVWLLQFSLPAFAIATFQPYPLAICLACSAILLSERSNAQWRTAGLAMLCLAVWVAPTVLIWVMPVGLLRALGRARNGESATAIVRSAPILLFGPVAVLAERSIGWFWPGILRTTRTNLVSPAEWVAGAANLAYRFGEVVHPAILTVNLLMVTFALVFLCIRRGRPAAGMSFAILAPTGLAILEVLVLGGMWWIHRNGFHSRYLASSVLFLCLQPVLLAVAMVGARFETSSLLPTKAMSVLVGCVAGIWLVAHFGLPSSRDAQLVLSAHMNRAIDDAVSEVNDESCTHLLGDYWRVWPVAFAANAVRYSQSENAGIVWPLSGGSLTMRKKWLPDSWADARVCVLSEDDRWQGMAAHVDVPIREGESGAISPVQLRSAVGSPGSAARILQLR